MPAFAWAQTARMNRLMVRCQDYTVERTVTVMLNANTFTRDGYTFNKWNTKADGSGDSYADQEKVKNLTTTGKTIKLYAVWKKK